VFHERSRASWRACASLRHAGDQLASRHAPNIGTWSGARVRVRVRVRVTVRVRVRVAVRVRVRARG